MKKIILLVVFILINFAFAQEKVLTVGLCAAYPPFESRDAKTGELVGFDIDLANEIGKILNKKVLIKDAQWQALLGGLKNNHYDVIISAMSRREAGVNNVSLSDTYYLLNDVIVVKKDNKTIKSITDLKEKVVGVQLGSGSEKVVDKLNDLKSISRYDYNPEAFLDLRHNRIDAVVVGYAYALNQTDFNKYYKIAGKLPPADLVAVLKKDQTKLTSEINKALSTLKNNGTYDKLINKWLVVK